jgi:6-pyruvoyltetrahydropterin/6-carboxytetrahydropterin synthase
MYEIFVRSEFASAHYLREYQGNCEKLHGHNWTVEAVVKTEILDNIGVGIDFRELKKILGAILNEFDHTCINDHAFFKDKNPSSELLAFYIFIRMKESLKSSDNLTMCKVTVCETPRAGVTYYE